MEIFQTRGPVSKGGLGKLTEIPVRLVSYVFVSFTTQIYRFFLRELFIWEGRIAFIICLVIYSMFNCL